MDVERRQAENAAYAALEQLRNAMSADPPRPVLEKLGFAIAELRIMLVCKNRVGLLGALRRADAALAIWEAWREGTAAEPV